MREFNFSENFIKKSKKNLLIVFLLAIVCMTGFALFITGFQLNEVFPSIIFAFLIMAVIFAIQAPLNFCSLRRIKILIHEDKIVKQCGKSQQYALWKDIVKMRRKEDTKGNLVHICLHDKYKKVIVLFGIDKMEEVDRLINENISDNVLVQTKRHRLNYEHPVLMALIMVTTLVVMAFFESKGDKVFNIFTSFIALSVGSWLLIFRPATKANLRFKWEEIILGLLLAALGAYGLVIILLCQK